MTLALAFACALVAQSNASTTTVNGRRGVDIDDERVDVDPGANANPEDTLLQAAGASLVHDGGPLAPARPMIRGLGGARVGAAMSFGDGALDLDDPATGLVDAAFLPWSAASALVVDTGAGAHLAGGARLALDRSPGARARFLVGSLDTVRASAAAGDGDALVAVDAGATEGDFAFRPTSPIGKPGDSDVIRRGNDQQRASVVGAARLRAGGFVIDALALAGWHSGGIAGMAAAPPLDLRGEDGLVGGAVVVERSLTGARPFVAVDARAAHRATFADVAAASGDGATDGGGTGGNGGNGGNGGGDGATAGDASPRSAVESTSARVRVGVRSLPVADGIALDVVSGASDARLVDGRFVRDGADAAATLRASLGPVTTRFSLNGAAVTDAGLLWGGEARAEIGDLARASLGVARASRAPTLDELYAPRGLVLGNPALRPEATDDVELALAWAPARIIDARVVGFAGVLEDGIAFVNRDAFSIEPVNLGVAWRTGVDTSITVEPSIWIRLDAVAEVLASRVDATGAPLPLAPPFSSRVALRAGTETGPAVTAALRSRGAAASNIFGTVKASGYSLLDLGLRAPLGDSLRAAVQIENVLDVKDARDANQLPLPGRLVFFTLEVRT